MSKDKLSKHETTYFHIAQLTDEFSRFEQNRDMIRFNLYKSCLLQLRLCFVKMHRVKRLYLDLIPSARETLDQANEVAFGKFKSFCADLMDLRKREVLAERRIIDTTTWPIEDTERNGEVVQTTTSANKMNPFEAFELEVDEQA